MPAYRSASGSSAEALDGSTMSRAAVLANYPV